MTAIVISLLGKFWPYLVLIAGAIGWGIKQRRAGRAEGDAKLAKARQKTAEELHEMDREATDAERKAAALSDEEARKEAMSWRKS